MIFISAFWGETKSWNKIVVILLCLFGLLRGETVGSDIQVYLSNIRHTTWSPLSWNYATNFEAGYNLFIACWNSISDNSLLFLGLNNTLFVLGINYYGKKKVKHYNLFLLFVYFLGYYVQSFNIMRQYFAIGLLLFILANFEIEKLRKIELLYISLLILAVGLLFHNTVLIALVIPVYYLIQNTPINKRQNYVLAIILSATIFYLDIIRFLLSDYSSLFVLNEKATIYYQSSFINEEEKYSLLRILLDNIFFLYLIYIYKKIDIYIFMLSVARVFINLFAPLNVLFVRIPTVLLIISIPLYVKLWYKHDHVTKGVILLYAILIFTNIMIKNYGKFQPYLFFWE